MRAAQNNVITRLRTSSKNSKNSKNPNTILLVESAGGFSEEAHLKAICRIQHYGQVDGSRHGTKTTLAWAMRLATINHDNSAKL